MKSTDIAKLLQKREILVKELNELNTQIIRITLDDGAGTSALSAVLQARGTARGAAKSTGAARGGARRKWFERGEMLKLSRKLLTQPMSQADLVRGLSTAKGYDKGLPTAEKARFKSAAYQAIAAALNGKQLFRNKQGQVSTRR